jgi:uncharacterized protein YjiS (DUF1127 family)
MHGTTISLGPSLATKAQRAWQALLRRLSRAYQQWLRARKAHATARVLNQLDDRLLRDLGLDRSELPSAAAELHGMAERQRRQAAFGTPLPR